MFPEQPKDWRYDATHPAVRCAEEIVDHDGGFPPENPNRAHRIAQVAEIIDRHSETIALFRQSQG